MLRRLAGPDWPGLMSGKSVLILLYNAADNQGLDLARGQNLTVTRGELELSILRISHGLPHSRYCNFVPRCALITDP